MRLSTEERLQIARLFNFFKEGEILAHNCAKQQAKLFTDPVSRRFLLAQTRQEKMHARVFKAGIGILAPRGIGEVAAKRELATYGRLLESAFDRGDACDTLLGMQIILEGMADIALKRISDGFPSRGLTFRRIRQLVVGQEDAHHAFGLRRFQSLLPTQNSELIQLQNLSQQYLETIDTMLISLTPLFNYFEEDPRQYFDEMLQAMPSNLVQSAA